MIIANKEILEAAMVGFQLKAEQAASAISAIQRMIEDGASPAPVRTYPRRGRPPLAKTADTAPARKPANYQQPKRTRTLSPKARRSIAQAQKKRWAKVRAEKKAAKKAA